MIGCVQQCNLLTRRIVGRSGEIVVQPRSPDSYPTIHDQHPHLRAAVTALDDRLRARHGVIEYTRDPDCIFRLQIVASNREYCLSDGVRVREGDRLINLHLWNEQIPPFPVMGPTLGWARCICKALDVSLRGLASYVADQKDLVDIAAISANMSFGSTQQSDQLVRISERFGFERVPAEESASIAERVHRLGENILYSMMMMALNPRALRAEGLWHGRTSVFLSRRKLASRYGWERPTALEREQNHDADLVSAGSCL
jgi:hypothetical protein